jgi:hypothetical protein
MRLVENSWPEATVTNVLDVAGLSTIAGCLLELLLLTIMGFFRD